MNPRSLTPQLHPRQRTINHPHQTMGKLKKRNSCCRRARDGLQEALQALKDCNFTPIAEAAVAFPSHLLVTACNEDAWAEGKGELATSRLRMDCGLETDSVYIAMVSIGRMR
jgi:hypothetical protein